MPRQYADMTGHGELWVGIDGLPLRQIIHLEFPPRPDEHRITSDITVDYGNFRTVARSSGGVLGRIPFMPTSSKALQQFALAMSVMSFAALVVVQRRSKKLYGALALSLIVIMVTTPLLQSVQAAAFIERWTKTTADSEGQTSSVTNPHSDSSSTQPPYIPALPPLRETYPTSTFQRRIALLQQTGDEGADSDGDGLTDYQEALLGTNPESFDTDGDNITDTLEVQGFTYLTQTWYADPLAIDTNADGIDD